MHRVRSRFAGPVGGVTEVLTGGDLALRWGFQRMMRLRSTLRSLARMTSYVLVWTAFMFALYVPFRFVAARYDALMWDTLDFEYRFRVALWPLYFFSCGFSAPLLGRLFRVRWFARLALVVLFFMVLSEYVHRFDRVLGMDRGISYSTAASRYAGDQQFNTTMLSFYLLWPCFFVGLGVGELVGFHLSKARTIGLEHPAE